MTAGVARQDEPLLLHGQAGCMRGLARTAPSIADRCTACDAETFFHASTIHSDQPGTPMPGGHEFAWSTRVHSRTHTMKSRFVTYRYARAGSTAP